MFIYYTDITTKQGTLIFIRLDSKFNDKIYDLDEWTLHLSNTYFGNLPVVIGQRDEEFIRLLSRWPTNFPINEWNITFSNSSCLSYKEIKVTPPPSKT